jgi:hypothetical protein
MPASVIAHTETRASGMKLISANYVGVIMIVCPEMAGAMTRPKGEDMPGKRGRSAITDRFVKQSTVKKNPKTTTNESVGKGRKKK